MGRIYIYIYLYIYIIPSEKCMNDFYSQVAIYKKDKRVNTVNK